MLAGPYDLIFGAALSLYAVADALCNAVLVAYAGGMPDGLSPEAAAAAAGAAAAAAGAAAYGPPTPPAVSAGHKAAGYHHYQDSDGKPYWPGISAVPQDGSVYPPATDEDRRRAGDYSNSPTRGDDGMRSPDPLPVDRATGRPVHPPLDPDIEGLTRDRPTAAITTAGRG